MLEYRIQPIVAWPGARTPDYNRRRSPFKTIWTRVLQLLEREIKMLDGAQVIFRLDVSERDVRQDGMLRAEARPKGSGVIIEFTSRKLKGSPRLLYRCDTFAYWQDNVNAIAKGLEALRLVDRYGVTPTGEQYAGFKALPSSTAPTMTTDVAAACLSSFSNVNNDWILTDKGMCKTAVREAISKTHPDRNNGDRSDYDRVDTARKVLSSHHGVSL